MPDEGVENVDDLTITRDGDDRFAPREEMKKKVLTTGAWATVVYMYKEMKRLKAGDVWSDPRIALVRYRKRSGAYKPQKEFAISNLDHARELRDLLTDWLKEE